MGSGTANSGCLSLDNFSFGTERARDDNVALGSNKGCFKGLSAGAVGTAAGPDKGSDFLEPLNCFDLLKKSQELKLAS